MTTTSKIVSYTLQRDCEDSTSPYPLNAPRGAMVYPSPVKSLLALLFLTFAFPAAAERHVYDKVGVIPRIDVARFEEYMELIQRESDIDIRFVFLPGLGGRPIEQVATETMGAMKIGRGTGQERGLLLLFDTRAR